MNIQPRFVAMPIRFWIYDGSVWTVWSLNPGLHRSFSGRLTEVLWVMFLLTMPMQHMHSMLHRCSSTHGWTSGRVIIFSNLSHLWLQVHVIYRQKVQPSASISLNPEITAGQPASPCRTVKKTMTSTYLCRRICHLPVRQEMWLHVMKCHPLPWSLQDSSSLSARSMDHHGKQPAMMTMMMTTNRRSRTGWRPFQHRVVSASCGLQTMRLRYASGTDGALGHWLTFHESGRGGIATACWILSRPATNLFSVLACIWTCAEVAED